ncbi:hypothetical protein SPLC1_S410970 [Arthrospira platensis C1]|nr:hypothetical protein SPLC1_S410970 [Arthrospira platensis C1]
MLSNRYNKSHGGFSCLTFAILTTLGQLTSVGFHPTYVGSIDLCWVSPNLLLSLLGFTQPTTTLFVGFHPTYVGSIDLCWVSPNLLLYYSLCWVSPNLHFPFHPTYYSLCWVSPNLHFCQGSIFIYVILFNS